MEYGLLLLNKVVEQNDVQAFRRHNIAETHFPTEGERAAYRFITDYHAENGKAPSYAAVTLACEDFITLPGVDDSYDYLAGKIHAHSAKLKLRDTIVGMGADFQSETDGITLIDRLVEQAAEIKRMTSKRGELGVNVKTSIDRFKDEYAQRKAGTSNKHWRSKYSIINDVAGGYVSSNMYVVYGKSGRGKSAVTLDEIVELAFQGANCLVWLQEMGWFEGMVRLYTYISARAGVQLATLEGVDFEAGFSSSDMRRGKFSDEFEAEFIAFLDGLGDLLPGNITIRAVDDENFTDKSLKALESDIAETAADVVLIDPFYYLAYERNTSQTAGGDAAATSQKLRLMTGRLDVVMFAITQADETDEQVDSAGVREVALPRRKDVKKTKSLLEDAAVLIAVDTVHKESRGLIGLNKGRDGGEDESVEIVYLPQIGVIKEVAEDASKFDF